VEDEAAQIYSEIIIALHAAGTPVATNDIWIAAFRPDRSRRHSPTDADLTTPVNAQRM
jgi:hypothetical protein